MRITISSFCYINPPRQHLLIIRRQSVRDGEHMKSEILNRKCDILKSVYAKYFTYAILFSSRNQVTSRTKLSIEIIESEIAKSHYQKIYYSPVSGEITSRLDVLIKCSS